ncbi:MAG: hypothetical protein KF812_01850 [Fimbriimonadaceae bacterium]|nr:hypothetical protein [Fimbriimonadaceae bacterium]
MRSNGTARTIFTAQRLQVIEMRSFVVLIAFAFLVLGCNQNQTKNAPPSNPNSPTTQGGSSDTGSNGPESNLPGVNAPDIQFPAETFESAPVGQQGWEPKPDSEAVLIGRKMDAALRDLRNGWARTLILVDDPKGKSQSYGEMKVQDRRHFNITYSLPRTEGSTNRLVGDGSMRALKDTETGFKRLPEFREPSASSVNQDTLENTLRDLPAVINRIYERDENVFEPLIKSLTSDGFEITVEQKTMAVKEEQRPIVRLVAIRKGDQPAEVEFVVDQQRGLPVTMRTIVPTAAGITKIMWTAEWGFGGEFDAKEFTVPIAR